MSDLLFVIQNIFTVLPKDIANMNGDTLIQAPLITAFFYFISRWFRAYILRLGLFLFGVIVLFQVFKGQSFLFRFDFYGGLGLMLPHIEIVELTYLILREKVLTVHYRTLAFLQVIASPFVWLYAKFNYLKEYYKAKQEGNSYQDFKQDQEDFKQKQWQEYRKEQSRRDEQERKSYQQQREEYNQNQEQNRHKEYNSQEEKEKARQEYQQKVWEQAQKEKANRHPRWDSDDPYIVLDVEEGATFEEIKKKYRQLSRIYHPDATLTNKEEHEEIFKKMKNAYEELEKRFK